MVVYAVCEGYDWQPKQIIVFLYQNGVAREVCTCASPSFTTVRQT